MGRRTVPEHKRTLMLATKISQMEREAFEEMCRRLGGAIPARESDALRFAVAATCRGLGIAWPEDASAAPEARPARKGPKPRP